uniref:Putative F-box/kelch-repeat protein n=1 Tax=Noccaea caerulescens TaxID=107243 RepID=A0A1J3JXL3_NOCCA
MFVIFCSAYQCFDHKEFQIPPHQINSTDLCVVDNVLYIYLYHVGLLWYDSKEKEWRVVHGLNLGGHICWDVALAEYNGKLAFMWHEREKSEVWCSVIALHGSSKVAIRGRVEWSSCILSDVPLGWWFRHYICQD